MLFSHFKFVVPRIFIRSGAKTEVVARSTVDNVSTAVLVCRVSLKLDALALTGHLSWRVGLLGQCVAGQGELGWQKNGRRILCR